jgi:WhiB family transcriptional regulator, redox-sensing transcriptional regulator
MSATWRGEDWRAQGACVSADPDLFFPISITRASGAQISWAKSYCARCEVCSQCLNWAMDHPDTQGIWGGLTDNERRNLRRARNRSGARARRAA